MTQDERTDEQSPRLLSVAVTSFLKGLKDSPGIYIAPLLWALLKIRRKEKTAESQEEDDHNRPTGGPK